MKNWVCDGFDFLKGGTDGLGCAKGLQRSRWDCSGGPSFRNGSFSHVHDAADDTPQVWMARFGYVEHAMATSNMPRPGAQTPKLNIKIEAKKSQIFICCEFGIFEFAVKMPAWWFTFRPITRKNNK